MQIHYCDGWFRARKRYTELWDEKKARRAYEKRKLYTVLIGDPVRPECFIEDYGTGATVEFLDDHLREPFTCAYQMKEPGRLFLTMMVERRFEGETDLVASGTAYFIKPDGTVLAEREDFPSDGTKFRKEGRVDPSIYWEDYPQFGQYEGLIRRRPVPAIKV